MTQGAPIGKVSPIEPVLNLKIHEVPGAVRNFFLRSFQMM